MSAISIVDKPIRQRRQQICEHNKIPQIILTSYQNAAIRLKERRKLMKLGDQELPISNDYNEHFGGSLWSTYQNENNKNNRRRLIDERTILQWKQQQQEQEQISRSHSRDRATSDGEEPTDRLWNRNEFWENLQKKHFRKCRTNPTGRVGERCGGGGGGSIGRHGNNRSLKTKESVIWLLRPNKFMRQSRTSVAADKVRTQCKSQTHWRESQINEFDEIETIVDSRSMRSNWSGAASGAIGKGTKEYYNERKRRFYEALNDEKRERRDDERRKDKMTEKINNEDATPMETYRYMMRKLPYYSTSQKPLKKIMEDNEKARQRGWNSRNETEEQFENVEYYLDKDRVDFSRDVCPKVKTCACHNCHFKQEEQKCVNRNRYHRSMEDNNPENFRRVDSVGSKEYHEMEYNAKPYKYSMPSVNQVADPIVLKQSYTQTMPVTDERSTISMDINCTDSFTRMQEFEKTIMHLNNAWNQMDNRNNDYKPQPESMESFSVGKVKISHGKKHRKHRKLKHASTKRKSLHMTITTPTTDEIQATDRPMETNHPNVKIKNEDEDSQENQKFAKSMPESNPLPETISSTQLDPNKRKVKSENDWSSDWRTSLLTITSESYNICFHTPVKCDKKSST